MSANRGEAVRRVRLHLKSTTLVWVDVIEYADGSVWAPWKRTENAPHLDGSFVGEEPVAYTTFENYARGRADFERRGGYLVRVEWLAGDPLDV